MFLQSCACAVRLGANQTMLRRIFGAFTNRRYVGADTLGNEYYVRPHPTIPGTNLRELVPPGGNRDPLAYTPEMMPNEWAHWLAGNGDPDTAPTIAPAVEYSVAEASSAAMAQVASGGGAAAAATSPAGGAVAAAAPEQPTAVREEGPTGPLSRSGTGIFEEGKGKYKPQGWQPGAAPSGGGAAALADPEPLTALPEEGPTGPLSRPGTGTFDNESKGKYRPSGWRPG